MREHWRQLPRYRRFYLVSDRGRVKSLHGKGRILKQSFNHCNKAVVCLSAFGYTETKAVHLLVSEAFNG